MVDQSSAGTFDPAENVLALRSMNNFKDKPTKSEEQRENWKKI